MKIKYILISIVLVPIILFSASLSSVQAVDNSALIAQIQAQIAQLTAQLQVMLAAQQGTTQTWCHTFNTNLGFANSGSAEVGYLHIALQREGISYAPDGDNVYADSTSRAMIIFQERYASEILTPVRLTRGTGFTASSTRAKLNALYGCGQTTQITPTTATCSESNWTSALSPTTCPASGQQTKTWTKIGACQNGAFHPTTETIICTPSTLLTTTCTSFTYSDWGACSASGTQTRTVTSSLPAGCIGGSSILSQACTYTQPSTSTIQSSPLTTTCISNWVCSVWSGCTTSSPKTRTCWDCNNCGVAINTPVTTQNCVGPSTITTFVVGDIRPYSGKTFNIPGPPAGGSSLSFFRTYITCSQGEVFNIANGPGSWKAPNDAYANSCIGHIVFSGEKVDPNQKAGVCPYNASLSNSSSITLTSPKGEIWHIGETYNITWNATGLSDTSVVEISLRDDYTLPGNPKYVIVANKISGNAGFYSWTIPATIYDSRYVNNSFVFKTAQYKIFISEVCDPLCVQRPAVHLAEGYFTIAAPTPITVTSPNVGEQWAQGSAHDITWQATGAEKVIIYLQDVNSQRSYVIGSSITASKGLYHWGGRVEYDPTPLPVGQYRVVITTRDSPKVTGSSTNDLTIVAPSITVTSPNGGENLAVGSTQNITWTIAGTIEGYVKIDLYKTGKFLYTIGHLATSTAPGGTYSWKIPTSATTGSDYTIRVRKYYEEKTFDDSDNYFSIVAPTTSFNASQSSLASISDAITKIVQEIQAMLNK